VKLPEYGENCFFATLDLKVYLGFRALHGFFDFLCDEPFEEVTHWMPCKHPTHPDLLDIE
jgi:hypothetical protein